MPLLEHFHPPLSTQRHWESFHTTWASAIADWLNEVGLPEGYFAEEQLDPSARVEIDIWPKELAIGKAMPDMPLALGDHLVVPVSLESAYEDACRRRRL
jgi:hypothetical protein